MKRGFLLLILSLIAVLSGGIVYAQSTPDDCELDLAPVCPTTRATVDVATQTFVYGFMLYRGDTGEIYVLSRRGDFLHFMDTWAGEELPQETPPTGQQQPQMGFGKVWLDNENVRNTLDWATDDEFHYTTVIETVEDDDTSTENRTYLRSPEGYTLWVDYDAAIWDYIYTTDFGPVAIINDDITPGLINPDPNYAVNGYFYAGERYTVTGRDITGEWWRIDNDASGSWVRDSDVRVENVEDVPVIETEPCVNDMSPYCPVWQRATTVTTQLFEHGLMVWIHDYANVYILTDDGETNFYTRQWNGETLTRETPPAGLYQPQNSFGYLWLNQTWTRNQLGWATEAEVTYDTTLEVSNGRSFAPSDDVTYLRLPDGRALGMNSYQTSWYFLDQ